MASQLFAAIDVGSFELELGIYEISNKNKVKQVDHVRHVIALGRETYNTGMISYEMVGEICDVLNGFVRIMKGYKVHAYRAYATSAMREAKNSQIVIDQIRVRTGIEVSIISNSELRFLSYKAIAAKDDEFDKNIQKGTAIVDVGFGSMQMSLFDEGLLVSTTNVPLGVLKILNTLDLVNTTIDRTADVTAELVSNELKQYEKIFLENRQIRHLIAIGDNILYLFRYENKGKLLTHVTKEQFDFVYNRLLHMNISQMEEAYGLSSEAARMLLPTAIIYKQVMEMTGAEEIWIPGIRLCDGIAAGYAADNKLIKLKHNFDADIISTSRNMAVRYRCKTPHAELVEVYALKIFDTMKRYHGMGGRERLLLQIAVIVHACGKFISVRNANECSYNIIMSTEIIGLSHLEREIIANVLRYNIRDFDYNQVQMEANLDNINGSYGSHKDVTILIAKLTAILRLADSMDRAHKQTLQDCKMEVKDGNLVVRTAYPGDMTLDAISFEQKASFFEEIFGIRPILKRKRSV